MKWINIILVVNNGIRCIVELNIYLLIRTTMVKECLLNLRFLIKSFIAKILDVRSDEYRYWI